MNDMERFNHLIDLYEIDCPKAKGDTRMNESMLDMFEAILKNIGKRKNE